MVFNIGPQAFDWLGLPTFVYLLGLGTYLLIQKRKDIGLFIPISLITIAVLGMFIDGTILRIFYFD